MGFLSGEDDAIMWRGLVLNRAVQHFLEDVAWGALDYLLVDMPPGTGDVQMGLARMLPRTELLVVTTPALAAQKVAGRAADMARKGNLRVAGVDREHGGLHLRARHALRPVRRGRGERLAADDRRPARRLGPARPGVSRPAGTPVRRRRSIPTARSPGSSPTWRSESPTEIAPVLEMSSCSARLLQRARSGLRRPAS